MAKPRSYWECQECGRRSAQYMGKCPGCGEFGTLIEIMEEPETPTAAKPAAAVRSRPQKLADVSSEMGDRYPVPVEELSRVLGGGLVPGSVILVGGDPGIGKSTLLLQVAVLMENIAGPVLYVSGEESERQIKMRAQRLDLESTNLFLVTETELSAIFTHIEAVKPRMVIVDSIQTTYTEGKASAAGSVTQVRECASQLRELAKTTGMTVFIVGHVTKEGVIAGPRVLEHIVDTVLYLEGDRFQAYRLLRSVKNRFGATSEVGVFEMRDRGMVEITNPSELFIAERVVNAPGSAIAVTLEGTRPLLVEVQALASQTAYPNPRRTANGVDFNRMSLIIAVLSKRVGIKLYEKDIFVNVISGLKVDEPAADLAVAVAIASSAWDVPVPADMVFVGEIGLSGELRAVSQTTTRIREAAKLGFKRIVLPRTYRKDDSLDQGIEIIRARSIDEALAVSLPKPERA
ncbi:MAG TPA: DNA repair protein RadA [Aggregatilinea sp.]|uniref:DNA repair protein RadA n=1 Tax=Aggregatilinea sp. TaxID=2806333 RepID=UPI002C56C324|nr:DNA repair protein RadA [Aggregatilinea sp.]HML22709.1 DNA repair protein RadA [Aggregatilinea sp.]